MLYGCVKGIEEISIMEIDFNMVCCEFRNVCIDMGIYIHIYGNDEENETESVFKKKCVMYTLLTGWGNSDDKRNFKIKCLRVAILQGFNHTHTQYTTKECGVHTKKKKNVGKQKKKRLKYISIEDVGNSVHFH